MICKIREKIRSAVNCFLITMCMICCCISADTTEASAITVDRIPTNSTIVPADYIFNTGYSNATWTVNDAYKGLISVLDQRSGSGCISFVVTRNTGGTRTFTNPITVTYKNAGYINGRSVDIRCNVDRLVQTGSTRTDIANCSGDFFTLWYTHSSVASYRTSGTRYKLTHTTDLSYDVTYADTGETVEFPFFQAVADLDTFQNVASVAEGFVPLSGYTNAYIYPACVLLQKSGGFFSPSQLETSGNDSYTKTGLYASTGNGRFTCRFYGTNCRTDLLIYSQYRAGTIPKPTLSIDGSHPYEEGDDVIIDVKQRIGRFFVDAITCYTDLIIEDDIPEGLTYRSARVYDQSGKDVTDKGSLIYDEAERKVSFEFSEDFIKTRSNYDGGTYTLEITTTADTPENGERLITDTAASVISTIRQNTNQQSIRIVSPIHVRYEYVSGTEGRTLPDSISTGSGDYRIYDDAVYYRGDTVNRKTAPAEGTEHKIYGKDGTLKGSWVLSWDDDAKTADVGDVTFTGSWRYIPAPRLVIVKKVSEDDEQFTPAHGEPAFLFRITAEGSGKVWYRAVTFTEEAVSSAVENGSYTDPEGTTFESREGHIYGICEAICLPEDVYTVEEIGSMRFDTVSCETTYHGNAHNGKAHGREDNTVSFGKGPGTVHLEMSKYGLGDVGFDAEYVSVCFENAKSIWSRLSHIDIIINSLKEDGRS